LVLQDVIDIHLERLPLQAICMLKLHLQVVQLIDQALKCGNRLLNRCSLLGTGINPRL